MRDAYDVLSATATTDAGGGQAVTWATILSIYGETQAMFGMERLQAGDRMVSDISHRVVTWRRSEFAPGQRLRNTARTFEIRAVLNVSPAYCYLECSEVDS